MFVTYENTNRDTLHTKVSRIYFRYINEIVIRKSFLEKRSCVESTLQLNFEENQENNLMSSIIPHHIVGKVKTSLTEYISQYRKNGSVPLQKPFENLYIEAHQNVTILFADIVNYTMMTSRLEVSGILDVLNHLCSRFDAISEKLKVLRVKFLGDCYYCVAGLPPDPAPNHAEACVDFGLEMIAIIAGIRKLKNLDINMRIGVHTGSISSGIIGTIKWQYDIWSKDVDLANKMETERTAGMVHITKETKNLLHKPYNIELSTKIVNNEPTYLVKPCPEKAPPQNGVIGGTRNPHTNPGHNHENQRRKTVFVRRFSTDLINRDNEIPNARSFSMVGSYPDQENGCISVEIERRKDFTLEKRHTYPSSKDRWFTGFPLLKMFKKKSSGNARISTNDRKRTTVFMNSNIKRYREMLDETNMEMEETIENLSFSKSEEWFKNPDMYQVLLVFKDFKSEIDFVKTPDPLFKYYILSEVLILLLVYVLENLTLTEWNSPEWPFYLTLGLIIFVFFPLTWTHYIWTNYFANFKNELPTNQVISFFYKGSKFITNNSLARFIIYTILYVLFCVCVLSQWVECYETEILLNQKSNVSGGAKKNFLVLMMNTRSEENHEQCIIPWQMTETFALAIIMSFLFLRMYMWLKLLYASAIAAIYSYCILQFSVKFYGDSQTFNSALTPEASHILCIFSLTLILHLVDRQTEYINRINYLWYKDLIIKEDQASAQHKVNTLLLVNILPIPVVKLYLNVNRPSSEEVYSDTYPNAAVMFASITNVSLESLGSGFLTIMSAIIGEFDLILVENIHESPIEKIKIAKWTYMAACGLVDNSNQSNSVISLLKFAARLMQKLKEMNEKEIKQDLKLRIGISHGSVAAGVVGSKKPLYDIWGDPVNMASRMDTLGLGDHIQVLEATARVIESCGYACRYRGTIKVKGREGLVPTYFVGLDENFDLVEL
ncbi:hypothetical protein Zmor_004941 [Zophobas morio]|uniref:adenylate cyclase n=1 Tax=Zophobas morio TaxID=2755281 RepID=A0AA38IWZ0_9CUCU|nr:hypothetical protein Zmor_004941 [Zophobas morio]